MAANEYQTAHTSDAAYIQGLYNDLLCREPTDADISFWTNYLSTHSRFDLAFNFATTPEAYGRAVKDVLVQLPPPRGIDNRRKPLGELARKPTGVSLSRLAILLMAELGIR